MATAQYSVAIPDPPNVIPRAAFYGVAPREAFVRHVKDPAPSALLASGATRAPPREFRAPGGEGFMDTPLANLPFEVWEPPTLGFASRWAP